MQPLSQSSLDTLTIVEKVKGKGTLIRMLFGFWPKLGGNKAIFIQKFLHVEIIQRDIFK